MTSTLYSEQWLRPGQSLKSDNGFHVFVMQGDDNLVLYSLGKPEWASDTDGKEVDGVILQGDGNLVIYAPGGKPLWASGADGRGESRLVMQDDRNVVTYDNANSSTWSSNTSTEPSIWQRHQVEISPQLMSALENDSEISPIIGVSVVCTTSP